MSFFKINGTAYPSPSWGLNLQRQQLVDSARNALGQVVAQKINRRIDKFDSLTWDYLDSATWGAIQSEIDKFEAEITYWDNPSQSFITRTFYWGDESAEVYKTATDASTGLLKVTHYMNCTCNIVDMGYD